MGFIICLIFHPRVLLVEKSFFVESMEINSHKNQRLIARFRLIHESTEFCLCAPFPMHSTSFLLSRRSDAGIAPMRASIRIKIRRSRSGDRPVVVGLEGKQEAHQNRALDIDRRRGGAVRGPGDGPCCRPISSGKGLWLAHRGQERPVRLEVAFGEWRCGRIMEAFLMRLKGGAGTAMARADPAVPGRPGANCPRTRHRAGPAGGCVQ